MADHTPDTPRTEAGRALLEAFAESEPPTRFEVAAILAIEGQVREEVVAEIRRRVRSLIYPDSLRKLDPASVYAILDSVAQGQNSPEGEGG